jgi:predicted ATP-grasp superfamily ATP-dependent carboligase
MTAISTKLFDAIQWHGIAEIEYVTHAETGEHYLIEINPRIWGGINSAIMSDLDIVGTLLGIAQKADVEAGTYRKNTQTRWFWGDIRVLPAYFSASERKLPVLREYLSLLFNGTKTDEFYLDDPMPFFVWPCHAIYKMLKNRTLAPVSYDSLQGEWE